MINGNKGGSKKPYQPIEQRDNLHSIARVKLLLALGEGEFQSTPTGRDIYLDDTPLQNADGSNNFNGVRYEYRSGTQHQEYIKGIPAVENEFGLNTEVKSSAPYVRAISDTSLSSVRVRIGFPQLVNMKDNGDVVGTSVRYSIELSTDGGSYVTVLQQTISGKTSGYEISRTVTLPEAFSGWQIRVRKLTGDSTSTKLVNNMFIKGVTEVIDAKLRYPNTALLYVEFDSSQFQNTPKVSVRVKGRAWPVPSNYNPETRSYSGIWDGTFKQAWTDNPVWIGYGLMTHERFGLGKRIKPENIDKWELYRISQYCDQLVPDGNGGQEPRFTCNMYIQSRADAWVVLRDIAAIYRGMTYWSNSQMYSIADMPRDIDYLFSRSNVIDGTFTYSGDSVRNIYTRALISYDNPDNMYNSDTTTVSDTDLMRRYRDNLLEISAIGCTRQSEAQRRGKWALLTNSKNRLVRFKVGLDGNIPRVGYIIGVADQLLSGKPNGGRVVSAQEKVVKLDRDTDIKVGDKLYLNTSTGESEVRTVSAVDDNGRTITVSVKYSKSVVGAQWASESSELYIQQYRVMSITKEDEYINIEAVYHNPEKYASIDTGARLEDRPITVIPPSVQAPPTNVTLSSNTMVEQGMSVTTMTIKWDVPRGASYSDVEWRKDDGDWIKISSVGGGEVDVRGIYSGKYVARVRCYNSVGASSVFAESPVVDLVGKEGLPPEVVNFTATPIIFGINLSWDFPLGALDTSYTEIVYSQSPDFATTVTLGNFAYPIKNHSMMGLSAGARFFFWSRLVDKSGNKGEWTQMIDGTSSADASEILDYIVGQITETELGNELSSKIDSIDGILIDVEDVNVNLDHLNQAVEDLGSVSGNIDKILIDVEDVNVNLDHLNQAVEDLELQLADITGSQLWTPADTYLKGSLVQFDDGLYRAKQDVPVNTEPTNSTYWEKIGDYASIGEAVSALSAQVRDIQVEVDEATGEMMAQVSTVNSLVAKARGERADGDKADALRNWQSQTSIVELTEVVATDKKALAERLFLLSAQLNDNKASISDLERVVVDESTSTASKISALEVKYDNNTADIQNEATARVNADSVLSQQISIVEASLSSTDDNLQGVTSSVQLLESEVTNLDGKITANSESITVLDTSLNDPVTGLNAQASALQQLTSTVSDLDGVTTSQGQVITQINSRIDGEVLDGIGAAQDAAQVAANLAGGKGEVIYSASAPVVAKRLTQNLWIDTTGNKNTPKRWDGSDWIVVTDKVATDAASAAADALAQVSTKAESSAVQALTTRVEDTEDGVSANSEMTTILAASLRGSRADGEKADSLRSWNTQVSFVESSSVSASEREVLAERLFAAEVQMGEANAQLVVLEKAFADENEATASQLTSLSSEISSTSSALRQEVSTRASETAALAQDVQALQVALGDVASADALAGLVTEVEELEGRVTASAQDIVSLSASLAQVVDDIATKADSSALQALTTEVEQIGEDVTANSGAITQLEVRIETAEGDISGTSDAVQQLGTTVTQQGEDISSQSQALTALSGRIEDAESGVSGNADAIALIETGVEEVDGRVTATAQSVTDLQASVGDNTAAIKTTSSALASLDEDTKAMWSTKLQVNSNGQYVFAGIGLGIENVGGSLQSQFLIEANRFALLNTIDGVTTSPFLVEGGQVFMNSAVIKKADIVNAVITGELRSGDYLAGQRGIRMNFVDGSFELNGSVAGQGRMVITNQRIDVRDNTGKLRVRMGLL